MNEYERGYRDAMAKADEIVADLQGRLLASAEKIRKDGTWNTGWPFYKDYVAQAWDRTAKDVLAASKSLRTIRDVFEIVTKREFEKEL